MRILSRSLIHVTHILPLLQRVAVSPRKYESLLFCTHTKVPWRLSYIFVRLTSKLCYKHNYNPSRTCSGLLLRSYPHSNVTRTMLNLSNRLQNQCYHGNCHHDWRELNTNVAFTHRGYPIASSDHHSTRSSVQGPRKSGTVHNNSLQV